MATLALRTSDGHELTADLVVPEHPRASVVFCHPHPLYGGNRFHPLIDALFLRAPGAGFSSIRFDFRSAHAAGVGERLDLVAALDALDQSTGPLFVVGYSFGAIVALSTPDPRIEGLVAIAPPLGTSSLSPAPPTLLLVARHDQFAPLEQVAPIVDSWSNPTVELEVVETADHFLVGHAATIADRTIEWLDQRLRTTA